MFMECPLPASQVGQRGSEDNPNTSSGSQPLTWAGGRPGVPAWVSESQRNELRCVLVTLWGKFLQFFSDSWIDSRYKTCFQKFLSETYSKNYISSPCLTHLWVCLCVFGVYLYLCFNLYLYIYLYISLSLSLWYKSSADKLTLSTCKSMWYLLFFFLILL